MNNIISDGLINKMALNIRKDYRPLIFTLVGSLLMLSYAFMFADSIVLDPSSYEEVNMHMDILALVSIIYFVINVALLLCFTCGRKTNLCCFVACGVTMACFAMIATISANSLPYLDDCRDLALGNDISVSECMNVVTVDQSYTGQEILDLAKLENASIQDNILTRELVP